MADKAAPGDARSAHDPSAIVGVLGEIERQYGDSAARSEDEDLPPPNLGGLSAKTSPLMHLALAVLDEDASRQFYEQHFGFEVARRAEDGTLMMRNADGFSLALGRWDADARLPAFLHHGFRAESPDDVHAHAARFRAERLEIVEEWDEPDYVSVKTRDPSGYVVEVAWERGRWA